MGITYVPPRNNKAKNIKIDDTANNFQGNDVEDALKELAESTAKIDDNSTDTSETWSANKLSTQFNTIEQNLGSQIKVISEIVNNGVGGGDISSIIQNVEGTNLFDKNNLVTSRPNDTGGTIGGTFSNWIPITKGRYYSINRENAKIWYFYDIDKKYVSWSASAYPKYIAPCDGYVLINLSDVDKDTLKVIQGTNAEDGYSNNIKFIKSKIPILSRWNGKRWLCIGDSITTEKNGYSEKSYASMVANNLGLQLTNISVGGKQLTDALTWVTDLEDTDFDLVTIMMGTNDCYFQGSVENITNNFINVITKIKERIPSAIIGYITPIKRCSDGSNGSDGLVNNAHVQYEDLITSMKIICRDLCIPVLDIYDTLDPRLEYAKDNYFIDKIGGRTETTHPSIIGHAKFIAPRVNSFLELLAPFYDYIDEKKITYSITNNLSNATNSNNSNNIEENENYTCTITANSGYTLNIVKVTMGGIDITNSVYNGGDINIANVTGNIVITCVATVTETQEPILLHSWNLSEERTTDDNGNTIYNDLTNNFDLILQSTTKLGNDRYYDNGGGLLLGKTDSFTLIINDLTGVSVYNKNLLNTGISGGLNIYGQSSQYPIIKGRFSIDKGTSVSTFNLNGKYYAIEKDSTTTPIQFTSDSNINIVTGTKNNLKITYDSANTVGKIYLNDNLVATINDTLLIDGIYLSPEKSHITYGEIKLYKGII